MDHLPTFHYCTESYPDVPYLSKDYDGKDFHGYPERQGWSLTKLTMGDFEQGHTAEVVAEFLQTWLYFGTLNELHLTGGSRVKQTDFVKKKQPDLLSSAKLEVYAAKWASNLKGSWSHTKQEERLRKVEMALDSLCRLSDTLYAQDGGPLLPEVVVSFKVLGQTIDYSLLDVELPCRKRDWGLQDIAARRMRANHWCPRDIALARLYLTGAPMYCASFVQRNVNPDGKDHDKCTEFLCEANQVDNDTYVTRHKTPDCQCEHWGPDFYKLTAKVRMGEVPRILINKKKQSDGTKTFNFELDSIRKAGTGNLSVVISHVWSDGMGNPHKNSIPTCQLEYIYNLLRAQPGLEAQGRLKSETFQPGLVSQGKKPSSRIHTLKTPEWIKELQNKQYSFWLDTLCIPLEDEPRKMAIAAMKNVYAAGRTTLVLDSELLQLDHKKCKPEESQLRIALSGWMRRCWTFQEAVISGGKLHIQFNDGAYDLPEDLCHIRAGNDIEKMMEHKEVKEHEHSKGAHIAGDVALKALALTYNAAAVYQLKKNPINVIRDPFMTKENADHVENSRLTVEKMLPLPEGILPISDRLAWEVKLLFLSMIGLWAQTPAPGTEEYYRDRCRRIVVAWRGLRYRTTSRPFDRFINFGFAASKSREEFDFFERVLCCGSTAHVFGESCPQPRLPKSDAFTAWLQDQPVLPAGFLFMKGDRLPGYQWAPNGVLTEDIDDDEPISRQQVDGRYSSSFEIKRKGFVLEGTPSSGSQFHVTDVTNSDSLVTYDVIEDSGLASRPIGLTGLACLIMSRWPQPGETNIGVLVDGAMDSSDGKSVKYVARVRMTALYGTKKGVQVVGRTTAVDQLWRVS